MSTAQLVAAVRDCPPILVAEVSHRHAPLVWGIHNLGSDVGEYGVSVGEGTTIESDQSLARSG